MKKIYLFFSIFIILICISSFSWAFTSSDLPSVNDINNSLGTNFQSIPDVVTQLKSYGQIYSDMIDNCTSYLYVHKNNYNHLFIYFYACDNLYANVTSSYTEFIPDNITYSYDNSLCGCYTDLLYDNNGSFIQYSGGSFMGINDTYLWYDNSELSNISVYSNMPIYTSQNSNILFDNFR